MASPLRILTIIGARPQIIKAAAISRAIAEGFADRIQETLLHTGQHYDTAMSQVFFDELGIPRPQIDLGVGSGSHGAQTARMIQGIEQVLSDRRPDLVLLYGDTNSTLAGSLAASKMHIPVAHVEAGLRSFDKSMPEELNRIVCDHCSTWLFCPTESGVRNLQREGFSVGATNVPTLDDPAVLNVGDVMYDNSLHFATLAATRSTLIKDHDLAPGGYILATVHRDGNTDDPVRLKAIIKGFFSVVRDHGTTLILPLHPRTRKCLAALDNGTLLKELEGAKNILLLPPAGFLDMIALERNARLVITDSGGVQKEAHFFNRPCVILRSTTEWVELVEHGQATLVDADPDRLKVAVAHFLSNPLPAMPRIFGDGHAAQRICAALLA